MSRVATRPLNPAATAAANASVAKTYPNPPTPGDQDYPKFQKAWMDAYVANGGTVTEQTSSQAKAEVQAAQSRPGQSKQTCGPVQSCPQQADTPAPRQSEFRPPATPCPCKLTSLTVTCSHGRSAKAQLLQIVSEGVASGDPVTATPGGGGDCGSNLVVRTSNHNAPTESYGLKPVKGNLSGPSSAQLGSWGWWNATPSRGSVHATACGGNSQLVRIERFPAGESKVQLNLSRLIDGLTQGFGQLPFDLRLFTQKGTTRQIRRAGEAKAEDFTIAGLKKRFKNTADYGMPAEFVGQLGSAWKEEPGNHLAYCEIVAFIGADPLFEGGFSILIYGIPVPKSIRKRLVGGVYLNVKGEISSGVQFVGKRYPAPKNTYQWDHVKGIAQGQVNLELMAEAAVWSEKVFQAKGGGSASAQVTGNLRNNFSSKFFFDYSLTVKPLTASITLKMIWGLFEYEKEWPIFDAITRNGTFELVDFS